MKNMKVYVVSLVLGIICVLAPISVSHAVENILELHVRNSHFQPDNLNVKAHTPFKIKLTNNDESSIEFESFSLNREREVAPGQSVTVYIPALSPGTYKFFDDFHKNNMGTITAK